MYLRCSVILLGVGLLFGAGRAAGAEDGDAALGDELKLKEAGLATDGAGLVNFFRLRAKGEVTAKQLDELLAKLEDKSAAERQKACAELVSIGPPAIPLLRQAAKDIDNPESAALARRCLKALETDSAAITGAAVRLLARRRAAGAAEVLLAYLPHAENDSVLDEVKNVLMTVAYNKGKPEPAVLKALDDEHPLRRASAIVALCSGGIAEPRAKLRKLLTDPMPSVRLRASLALARVSDAKAVSTLIGLLGDVSAQQAGEIEGFLSELAGEMHPGVALGGDQAAREKARDAWAKWWLDTEGPRLLEEVTKRTLTEAMHAKAQALIEKLGDTEFEVRQKAEEDLRKLGSLIQPLLRQAEKHTDPEIRKRAKKCLQAIENDKATPLSPVTARLIAIRKPKGAAEALLAFLPFADDESLQEELQSALSAVAYPEGKPSTVLVTALKDKSPTRRAAAAVALANGPMGELHKPIARMLKDTDAGVRLKVALALAYAREIEAVPVLIALIGELPPEGSALAEEYLLRLAKDQPPKGLPDGDEGRKKRSELWGAWWNAHKASVVLIDRHAPAVRQRYLGYTLMCQQNTGKVIELGTDGKERWSISGLANPFDAQVLPGNRVLIAEYNAQRVTERDFKGNIKWQKTLTNGWPTAVQRLRNGNTFIVSRNFLMEVDRSGRVVKQIDRPGHDLISARKLPNGHIVMLTSNRQVIRMDRTGKEVSSYLIPFWFSNQTEIMDNGAILLPVVWQNMVIEYDPKGKEVQRLTVMQPMYASRTPKGETLVASQNWPPKIYVLDKKGKEISQIDTGGQYVVRVKRR
jgi:HEAT repeat protein